MRWPFGRPTALPPWPSTAKFPPDPRERRSSDRPLLSATAKLALFRREPLPPNFNLSLPENHKSGSYAPALKNSGKLPCEIREFRHNQFLHNLQETTDGAHFPSAFRKNNFIVPLQFPRNLSSLDSRPGNT